MECRKKRMGILQIHDLWLSEELSGIHCNRFCNVADFEASYEETSTTALSVNPAVAVSLQTVNGWILRQRKVMGGSVSFQQDWTEYRDGFGSAAGNDNYWLGLEKVYRLVQLGSVRLRVENWEWTEQVFRNG